MFKTKEEWLKQVKGITEEQLKEKGSEELVTLLKEYQQYCNAEYEKAVKAKASKEDLQNILDESNKSIDSRFNEFKEVIVDLGTKVKAGMGNASERKQTLVEEITEKKEAIKKLLNSVPGNGDILIKALTNRAAISDNDAAVDLPDVGRLPNKRLTVYESLPKITVGRGTHNGTIRYYDWDNSTTVRAAEMVAEGAAFPESTAKWQKYTKDLKKVGDTIPVTEEFFEDEVLFSAELEWFLRTNVDIKINEQLTVGDDTGENMEGLYTAATAYSASAAGITDASIYDLIVKVSESITSIAGSKYLPNVAYMNISDINKYRLKKDGENNYILPPFVSENGRNIDGVTIIENNDLTANTMVMGDSRFARIYEMEGTSISRGTKGDQFVEDEITLKARRRMLLLVRNIDKVFGWRKVTSISAALTTLAS